MKGQRNALLCAVWEARSVLYILHMGLVRAQAAKVMTQRRKSGMILVVHLVGALWLLASD